MREPFSTPRTEFIVQPKRTLLPYSHSRFGRAHGKVSNPIELVEHELGSLPVVKVRVRCSRQGLSSLWWNCDVDRIRARWSLWRRNYNMRSFQIFVLAALALSLATCTGGVRSKVGTWRESISCSGQKRNTITKLILRHIINQRAHYVIDGPGRQVFVRVENDRKHNAHTPRAVCLSFCLVYPLAREWMTARFREKAASRRQASPSLRYSLSVLANARCNVL